MDATSFDAVITSISSVGFPIVACCFMGWLYVRMNETLKDLTVAITALTTKVDSIIHS